MKNFTEVLGTVVGSAIVLNVAQRMLKQPKLRTSKGKKESFGLISASEKARYSSLFQIGKGGN